MRRLATLACACAVSAACIDFGDIDPKPIGDDCLDEPVVYLHGTAIEPMTLSIRVGTEVNFLNHGEAIHQLMEGDHSAPPLFESPILQPGDCWKHRFGQAGEYVYHCPLHPDTMAGAKIVVQ